MTKIPQVRKWDGKPISEPGFFSHVSMAAYHGANLCDGPSISSSGLRTIINQSPAHYYAFSPYNPDREEKPESDALTLGRGAHFLLLGESDFSTHFIQRPAELVGEKWHGNRTACKRWLAEQEAAGRTVLTEGDVKTIRGMARSLADNVLVRSGCLNGLIETTMVWRCKETGLWLKARPDAIPTDSGDFCDLKTTTSVQSDDLRRTIYEYGYHVQGSLIAEGWHVLTGGLDVTFTLAFVEKSPPWCVRLVQIPDVDLARGEMQLAVAKRKFKQCMDSGYWPGPGNENDAEPLGLPKWVQERIDLQLEQDSKEAA